MGYDAMAVRRHFLGRTSHPLGIAGNAFYDGYAGSVDYLNWNDFSDDKQCRTCLSIGRACFPAN